MNVLDSNSMRDSEGKDHQDQVVGKVCQEESTLQVTLDSDRVCFSSESKRLALCTFVHFFLSLSLFLSIRFSDPFPLLELKI